MKGPVVLVGHESDAIATDVCTTLVQFGFRAIRGADGTEVLHLVAMVDPDAVVLDVGLTGVLAFEVIERLRAQEVHRNTPCILMASVFNRTAYKRRPSSLYGADDYVEQHHIPDQLPSKLRRLLGMPDPNGAAEVPSVDQIGRNSNAEFSGLPLPQRARAVAHSVAGDIVLYHSELFHGANEVDTVRFDQLVEAGAEVVRERLPHYEGDTVALMRTSLGEVIKRIRKA